MRDLVGEAEAPPPTVSVSEAWAAPLQQPSLGGAYRSRPLAHGALRGLLGFLGPALLVAVGYVDPGNWATGLAAGSAYGDELLFVVAASSLAAMLLQSLAAKLGIVTGRDLAQACGAEYGRLARVALWILAEIAICACDMAELIGAAIALKLLFRLPLEVGAALTSLDVFLLLGFGKLGLRRVEAIVGSVMAVLAAALVAELAMARPAPAEIVAGLLPRAALLADPGRLYLAVGILGATVMPHNLYLHSALVQTRRFPLTEGGRRGAIRSAALASVLALAAAGLANGALVTLAAATFHKAGLGEVSDLAQAARLLQPLLGPAAAIVFALGLLASAQNATLTGTVAGQVVMEGFLDLRIAPWKRRLLTRGLALAPTLAALAAFGDRAAGALLIASQVVLSLQLPFALAPLIRFTSDRRKMGAFANSRAVTVGAWVVCALVLAADAALVGGLLTGRA